MRAVSSDRPGNFSSLTEIEPGPRPPRNQRITAFCARYRFHPTHTKLACRDTSLSEAVTHSSGALMPISLTLGSSKSEFGKSPGGWRDRLLPSFFSRLLGRARPNPYAPADPVEREMQSTDDYITIEFLERATGALHRGTVGYRVGPDTLVSLAVWQGPSCRSSGLDLCEAFIAARQTLERDGFIPLVAGASVHCYPSGMARNMGEGDQVYRLTPGKSPEIDDLAFMFEPADAETVATVGEQAKAFERWARSVAQDDGREA